MKRPGKTKSPRPTNAEKKKVPERERSDPGPESARVRRSGTPPPNKYDKLDKLDELVSQQDEIAKAKEEREKANDPARQKQPDRERKPDRDPDRDR